MGTRMTFLGMGNMGKAISQNLVTKGNLDQPLILWNRTHSISIIHAEAIGGSVAVDSVQEAVTKSDIIWSCLADQEAVASVFDTILKMDIKQKVFVECSTMTPQATTDLCHSVIQRGGEFVAMPVFGEPGLARAGKLICAPAGKALSIARINPYLKGVICRDVINLSDEKPAKASLLKNVGNVLILTTMETVSECHVLAEKSGLRVEIFQDLLQSMFPIGPHSIYSRGLSSGRYFREQPIVNIDSALSLSAHISSNAERLGVSLKAYDVTREHLRKAKKYAGGNGDILGIYGAVRLESGLPYELNDHNPDV
ncbi:putative oxidoreductase [Lachnellula subtilissima]|uniref:Putative oxidoreductase n=1 Tax=Lachnellula subtilissima TaxID=602034 RepID=A0A8H8S104_9HELO|nr:putative oxidoreductase [Lachnellula subtilissima]